MAKSTDANPVTPMSGAARNCPICGKPAAARHQPFCSARCADVDLGRWLKETYSIPTEEAPDDAPSHDES
jgi:endogenous inhibitor of DNA gyrase (YacG/DUF329 family)